MAQLFTVCTPDGDFENYGGKELAENTTREWASEFFSDCNNPEEFQVALIDWNTNKSTVYVYEVKRTEEISVTIY